LSDGRDFRIDAVAVPSAMPVKRLLPEPASAVELVDAYSPPEPPVDRPSVRCNMISTFDGAIAVNGRSGLLGGPADRRVFSVLRSWADVIVVGAGTVRAENYGPVRLDDDLRDRRRARGQPPVPPIAIVTRSGNLDWSSSLFTEAEIRPLVVTSSDSDAESRVRGEHVADFVLAGTERVDVSTALDVLHRLGHRLVLLEGGPGLNADFVAAGLLDELCLTLSPRLVAGSGSRLFAGPELMPPVDVEVGQLLEEDGFLFLRLRLTRRGG
jgi:riboflavin biosynthesis pyrimidine reductase